VWVSRPLNRLLIEHIRTTRGHPMAREEVPIFQTRETALSISIADRLMYSPERAKLRISHDIDTGLELNHEKNLFIINFMRQMKCLILYKIKQ